ncbi:hypothetical protein NDU88_009528 [Pleurodeles waltl]|uniref:Uncharacterized protein n=1 Tax=Pleurodeles waltl TaxID=8319 RepID=A0AAV7RWD5_PLEWA|nr:hypothetical protein NDU88_009528 [Pleurodeles waltl]
MSNSRRPQLRSSLWCLRVVQLPGRVPQYFDRPTHMALPVGPTKTPAFSMARHAQLDPAAMLWRGPLPDSSLSSLQPPQCFQVPPGPRHRAVESGGTDPRQNVAPAPGAQARAHYPPQACTEVQLRHLSASDPAPCHLCTCAAAFSVAPPQPDPFIRRGTPTQSLCLVGRPDSLVTSMGPSEAPLQPPAECPFSSYQPPFCGVNHLTAASTLRAFTSSFRQTRHYPNLQGASPTCLDTGQGGHCQRLMTEGSGAL